jgi:hypothetical protein
MLTRAVANERIVKSQQTLPDTQQIGRQLETQNPHHPPILIGTGLTFSQSQPLYVPAVQTPRLSQLQPFALQCPFSGPHLLHSQPLTTGD